MGQEFSSEQKYYLEGFVSGVRARAPGLGQESASASAQATGPDRIHLEAMARFEAEGKKLVDQEKWKREEHPFDAYSRLNAQAARNEYPKPPDNFRWRYYGLFYVAPNQPFYMARLRIPNGIVTHWQMAGLADIAETYGGGGMQITTRANIQIREIEAKNAVRLVEAVQDLGLNSRGAGADNIRNVTGDATAGIATTEYLDTRPYAKAWQHHIYNERALFGLPRKFNVAFDGGGPIPTLEETNDVGFQAVMVGEGAGVTPGLYWRLMLGGISGHRDLARDTGVILKLDEAIDVADAIIRVFIAHGDRTNRAKARLKYVLDAWGFEKFLTAVEAQWGRSFVRVDPALIAPRPAQDRLAHIGAHPQKQAGLSYVGVAFSLGRMSTAQARALACAAQKYGDGDLRFTVWQNLLISGVANENVAALEADLSAVGLACSTTFFRAGLVACTGASGCKLANAKTKENAEAIAAHCDSVLALDQPVNIHVTGCPNSCAQHYIGDIGLIGARVEVNDEGDTIDGFNIVVGGGFGHQAGIARDVLTGVRAEKAPLAVEGLLKSYLALRDTPHESFQHFAGRHSVEALAQFAQEKV